MNTEQLPEAGEPSFLIGFGGLSRDINTEPSDDLMNAWQIKKGEEPI